MNYSGLHRLDEEETPVDEQPTMEVKPSQLPPPPPPPPPPPRSLTDYD